jgi:hypothetical protein
MNLALDSAISFDWFILALRIVFIALIYWFLYQVARVSIRELVSVGMAAQTSAVPTLPSPSSSLEIVDPAESSFAPGDVLPLEHYTTIGRREDNSLVLDDSFVSSAHAELVFDQGGWWISDTGSTNGTYVNQQPVRSRTRIAKGDIVQFGRIALRANI